MFPNTNNTNTFNNLRWRARVTKEASANDDSKEYYINQSATEASLVMPHKSAFAAAARLLQQYVILFVSLIAILMAVTSLSVTRTWFLAVSAAFTVLVAVIVIAQVRLLRHKRLQTVNRNRSKNLNNNNNQRDLHRALRLQKERRVRQVLQLEREQSQLQQHVPKDFQTLVGTSNEDPHKWSHLAVAYKAAHEQLHAHLTCEIQAVLLRAAVLATNQPSNESKGVDAMDQLVQSIQSTPGVVGVNESVLRDRLRPILEAATTMNTNPYDNPKHTALVDLLRQVQVDASTTTTITTTRNTSNKLHSAAAAYQTPYRKQLPHQHHETAAAAVFELDSHAMLLGKQHKVKRTFTSGSSSPVRSLYEC
jgi:hypothetical protein